MIAASSGLKEEIVPNKETTPIEEPTNHVNIENNNLTDVAEFSDDDDVPLGAIFIHMDCWNCCLLKD